MNKYEAVIILNPNLSNKMESFMKDFDSLLSNNSFSILKTVCSRCIESLSVWNSWLQMQWTLLLKEIVDALDYLAFEKFAVDALCHLGVEEIC